MHTTTSGKFTRLLGLALTVVLAATACYMQAARAASDAPALTVGYFKGPNPETVGQKYGIFPSNIRFSTVQSGVTAFQEMVGGSLQLAGGIGTPPLALALLKSMPLKVIYVEYTFDQSLVVNSSIKGPKDLVGKTIAVTTGTTGDQSFSDYLKKNGLDPSSVKTVNMTGTTMLGAFKRGNIDGGYIWDPVRSAMIASGGHALDTTAPLAAVVASEAVIKAHPAAIQSYVCDIGKANAFILGHRKKALKVFTALLGGDRATAEQIFKTREYLSPKDSMTKWMGKGTSKLADAIGGAVAWANSKSATPSAKLPDPNDIIDAQFVNAAAGGACK